MVQNTVLTLYCLRMQKIFSTRLEEAAINEVARMARKRGISKRKFLEDAIYSHARHLSGEDSSDIWSETLGSWRRREKTQTTIRTARRKFQQSIERHQRKRHARLRR